MGQKSTCLRNYRRDTAPVEVFMSKNRVSLERRLMCDLFLHGRTSDSTNPLGRKAGRRGTVSAAHFGVRFSQPKAQRPQRKGSHRPPDRAQGRRHPYFPEGAGGPHEPQCREERVVGSEEYSGRLEADLRLNQKAGRPPEVV